MFPKTKDLADRRARVPPVDRDAWLQDILDAEIVMDDDPLNSRA